MQEMEDMVSAQKDSPQQTMEVHNSRYEQFKDLLELDYKPEEPVSFT